MADSAVGNDGTGLAASTTTRTLEPASFRATKRSRPNNNSDNNDSSNSVLQKEETVSDAAAFSEPQLSQGSVERNHNESSPITKKVRFSNQEPQVISFSWFDDLTDEEEAQLRLLMWYTRRDFDEFCRDRVDTVRVWRSVGGGDTLHHELEAYYCLRGLEPYQSSRLNTQLHAQRLLHHQALRNEQTRQRLLMMKQQPPPHPQQQQYDHERLRQAVEKLSAWALQRARRLALLDQAWLEQERLREASASSTLTTTKTPRQRPARRRSSVARQVVAQHRQEVMAAAAGGGGGGALPRCHRRTASESCLSQGASVSAGSPESVHRESGTVRSSSSSSSSNGPFLPTHHTAVSSSAMIGSSLASRRLPVDINRLKRMNEEFLQRMMTDGKPTRSDGHLISSGSAVSTGLSSYSTHHSPYHPVTNTAPAEGSIESSSQAQEEQRASSMTTLTAAVPPHASAPPVISTSLESILLRKHRQQIQRLQQQLQQRGRRHSLASSHVTDPDKLLLGSRATSQDDDPDVEAPFFIRRDSLHGLRYYHHHHHNPTGTLASSSPQLQLQEEEEEQQQQHPVAVESRT